MTTLMATKNDQIPNDLAMLRAVRLVVAQETEMGRRWAESRIKSITGGDPITARFMRGEWFTYTPHFKLVIVGNHKPALRSVDEAIRRRIHLIPFTVTIPPADRDKDLFERLKPEWPGVMQWAIDGCLEWNEAGLAPPDIVRSATDKYLADEDSFAHWVDEKCITGKGLQRSAGDLWGSYKAWCALNNEDAGTQKAFGQELERRGFDRKRTMAGISYRGIDLKPIPPDPRYGPDA
jgi:putative DNA primase/helicase